MLNFHLRISSLICFVRALSIEVRDNRIVLRLSHNTMGFRNGGVSSLRSDFTQSNSEVVWARVQYPTFTRGCFLELYDTRLWPKKMQDPEVERRPFGSLASSESLYAHKENFCDNGAGKSKRPCLMVLLRYRKILLTTA